MTTAYIVSTRPDIIKMAEVIRQAHKPLVIHTGQHLSLVENLITTLGINVTENLSIQRPEATLNDYASDLLVRLPEVYRKWDVDKVVVYGDTNSAFSAALAAFNMQLSVAHIEAGLRTYNKTSPYPEEVYRRLITHLADQHFCPTQSNKSNLMHERVQEQDIHVVGNTGLDTLRRYKPIDCTHVQSGKVLVTLHRRENQKHLYDFMEMIDDLARIGYEVIFPVHPNPVVQDHACTLQHVTCVEPMEYPEFVRHLYTVDLVLSDSGGIQEECTFIGTPCVIMRDTTERPEAVESGICHLAGTDAQGVYETAIKLLDDPPLRLPNMIFGDGHAAEKIHEHL